MTSSYPLYDFLLQQVKENEKPVDIKELCLTINSIGKLSAEDQKEHYDEIYQLMLHHELLTNGGILLSSIPYDGKIMFGKKKSDVVNILMNLSHVKIPILLKQILAQYVEYYKEI